MEKNRKSKKIWNWKNKYYLKKYSQIGNWSDTFVEGTPLEVLVENKICGNNWKRNEYFKKQSKRLLRYNNKKKIYDLTKNYLNDYNTIFSNKIYYCWYWYD